MARIIEGIPPVEKTVVCREGCGRTIAYVLASCGGLVATSGHGDASASDADAYQDPDAATAPPMVFADADPSSDPWYCGPAGCPTGKGPPIGPSQR